MRFSEINEVYREATCGLVFMQINKFQFRICLLGSTGARCLACGDEISAFNTTTSWTLLMIDTHAPPPPTSDMHVSFRRNRSIMRG